MLNIFNKKYIHVPHLSISNAMREVGRNPFVDWIVILGVGFIFVIISSIAGFRLYREVVSGNIKSTDATVVPIQKTFNTEDLSYIINRFEEKNTSSMQAKRGYTGPSDPSL